MNKKLLVLLVTYNTIQFAGAMVGPIYALFVERVGGDLLAAGVASATYSCVTGVFMILFGKMQDRLKDKKLLMANGFMITGAAYFLYMFANNMWTVLLLQSIIGISNAMYSPAHDMLYGLNVQKDKEGLQWGSWEATNSLSLAFGAVFGGVIASVFGFSALFLLMSLISISSSIGVYLIPKNYFTQKQLP